MGITNQSNNSVISDTITPSDSQTVNNLMFLNSSQESNANSNITALLKAMEDSLLSRLDSSINTRISSELNKHLGVDKNLTSSQVIDYKNRLGFTYKKIIQKENQVKILETHIEQNSTPIQLCHQNFPHPFHAFETNILYIEKYNKIVEDAQKAFMELEITYFKEDISILKNDIKVFKDILRYHVTDLTKLDDEIREQQSKNLKKTLDTSMVKVAKIIARPFLMKNNNIQNNKKEKPHNTFPKDRNSNHDQNGHYNSRNTNRRRSPSRKNNNNNKNSHGNKFQVATNRNTQINKSNQLHARSKSASSHNNPNNYLRSINSDLITLRNNFNNNASSLNYNNNIRNTNASSLQNTNSRNYANNTPILNYSNNIPSMNSSSLNNYVPYNYNNSFRINQNRNFNT